MLVFSSIWGIAVAAHQIENYVEIRKIVKSEKYQTTEGIIEDFNPMPYAGHQQESFKVNGIGFSYSDFHEEHYEFNN